ncbi:RNA polymerase sigma factor [Novosphingobium lindaniclasticum]|uniref:RNA polymerase sigma factor 70 region 4 type 2 domain-containing protein n=1 Tax=Novosphingobium lindaniclasticum LE124 TaxID=1096930 RepID=T0I3E6_9SPHN|nr:sigma-70 family RNA polymerase sigma factor [Novosphingobium lindaniclasticum]EQB18933.1 hypothetical protein L284_03475 [Novosphingobium lindaniclasticum LE124]
MTQTPVMADEEIPSREEGLRAAQLENLRYTLERFFQRRVKEREDIPDLIQDVFVRLLGRGGEANIEHLNSYVLQIAASVLVDRSRRRSVRHHDDHVQFDPQRSAEADIGPDRIVAGREALRMLMFAVEQMPERTRSVFVLRRLEQMSYKEIAKRLGLSVSAVEKHMVRAAERLASLGDLP